MTPAIDENSNLSYSLILGGISWKLTAERGAESWLAAFAKIMQCDPRDISASVEVTFVRRRPWRPWQSAHNHPSRYLHFESGTDGGLRRVDLKNVTLWYRDGSPQCVCELRKTGNRGAELLMMWQSLHALYRGVIDYGGFPIHAALFERNGVGALLVAGEGVGKSTCASRIPAPWRALSDDAAVVTPLGASRYIAHPFPTWSALLQGRDDLTWSVQTGVPLAAIFFLERGDKDEVIPVGQGRAAFMTHASAWYICSRGMPDASKCDKADFNKRIFLNTCEPVRRIPAYILRATLEGAFWKEMDKVVPV